MAEPTRDVNQNIGAIREMSRKVDGTEAISEFYSKWAANYDEDLEKGNYRGPAACAEAFSKVMSDKNAPIVDIAAGTGKVGQELAKLGFKQIDAVDFSQESLDISASKGVYDRLICDSVGKNKLKGVTDGYYSGLISVGAISVGHISQDAFPEFTRIVKKGGVMVFTVGRAMLHGSEQIHDKAYRELCDALDDIVRTGVWELVDKSTISYFCDHEADMYTVRRL